MTNDISEIIFEKDTYRKTDKIVEDICKLKNEKTLDYKENTIDIFSDNSKYSPFSILNWKMWLKILPHL